MRKSILGGTAVVLALASTSEAGELFDAIKERGHIKCGITAGTPGFSYTDEDGTWKGFNIDLCRAVAAAMFGDAERVEVVATTPATRFTAAQTGEIDIVSNMTWTYGRDVGLGLQFVGVAFITGQGFMLRKDLGIEDPMQLDGVSACTAVGTTSEVNVADFFRKNNMSYRTVTFENPFEMITAYDQGRCDLLSLDHNTLTAFRFRMSEPDDHVVFPEMITRELTGSFVSDRDPQWFNLNRWTLMALLKAEELGVDSTNVDDMLQSDNPEILRLLGVGTDLGEQMGVSADWVYNIVKQVGNYGEIYDRNIGPGTQLGIPRGENHLWINGGLHVPAHVR